MYELTVRDTKPLTGGGKHIWAGPLGTTKPTVSFPAKDYPVGTVLRVEIVQPTPDEAVAAAASETVAEQSPPREKPVRGERSNPPRLQSAEEHA